MLLTSAAAGDGQGKRPAQGGGKSLPKLKCSEALPGPKLSARFRAFAEEVASSEDSDKGEINDYSEGDNGHFGEDGGHEHYFIGDEEGRCSGSSST
eukprot:CAMPEP_0203953276 /NCGR_PEP_ID=MMETSP0359-20131031/86682_1 /ASSEMBLY_ACC=CAM_ASM_000338 /TAXON_ID=268821 /ORGANISM="Scrippsiella Hangoei, Strain SHTV-5" /LENGTH=95 /DNA_ID=CAMNT_0050886525 /DNA_START=48 /DNA_END=333 /DNA_ORIENTATION=+